MLLGREDNIVGHSPSRIWQITEAHVSAYQYDDIDRLMKTVSPRGGIWSGLLPPQGAVILRTTDDIRTAYSHALAAVKIGVPEAFVAVTSDWYVLVEATNQVVEKATGRVLEMNGFGLYGADETALAMDTDIGSIVLAERPRPAGQSFQSLKQADAKAHQRRLDAVCAGDVDGALSGIGNQLDLFLPCFDPDEKALQTHIADRDSYRAYWQRFLGRYRVETSRRANLLSTGSWAFSEVEWTLADLKGGGKLGLRFAFCEAFAADGTVRGGIGVAVRV